MASFEALFTEADDDTSYTEVVRGSKRGILLICQGYHKRDTPDWSSEPDESLRTGS
jgi:hypothetical protein